MRNGRYSVNFEFVLFMHAAGWTASGSKGAFEELKLLKELTDLKEGKIRDGKLHIKKASFLCKIG